MLLFGNDLSSYHLGKLGKTTARVGSPMVMQRAGEARQHLVVAVESRVGSAWEKELSRACGRVLWGFSRGMWVGLVLPEERLRPSNGAHWRRTLLGRLANQPEGGGG